MSAVETAVELIEHLDFDAELMCEHEHCGGMPADFACRCRACALTALICSQCRKRLETIDRSAVNVRCNSCMTVREHLAELVEFIPIRRA